MPAQPKTGAFSSSWQKRPTEMRETRARIVRALKKVTSGELALPTRAEAGELKICSQRAAEKLRACTGRTNYVRRLSAS